MDSPLAILARFLRFGLFAWGGPVAQIAMVRRALVDEEHWISSDRFNRLLAVYQLLPGPEAHELCVHFGMIRGGRLGGLAAGLGFMLPGFLLVLALAALYTRFDLSALGLGPVLLGIQLAMLALVAVAAARIGSHILLDRWLWAIAAFAFAATLAGAPFWLMLAVGAGAYPLARAGRTMLAVAAMIAAAAATVALLGPDWAAPAAGPVKAVADATPAFLFLVGLKAGLLTFGGAYTAIPFVRDDTVGRGLVTDAQFLDGLALSSMVPAPLVVFATFVGYLAGGLAGAFAITAGIFLPAFAMTLIFFDRLEQIVEHPRLQSLLAGVAAAVVGLIGATLIDLGRGLAPRLDTPIPAIFIAASALALLLSVRSRWTVLLLIPLAGLAGALLLG
jgi:chromate transporter